MNNQEVSSKTTMPHSILYLFKRRKEIGAEYTPTKDGEEGSDVLDILNGDFAQTVNKVYESMSDSQKEKHGGAFVYHAWQAYAIGLGAFGESVNPRSEYMKKKSVIKCMAKSIKQSLGR